VNSSDLEFAVIFKELWKKRYTVLVFICLGILTFLLFFNNKTYNISVPVQPVSYDDEINTTLRDLNVFFNNQFITDKLFFDAYTNELSSYPIIRRSILKSQIIDKEKYQTATSLNSKISEIVDIIRILEKPTHFKNSSRLEFTINYPDISQAINFINIFSKEVNKSSKKKFFEEFFIKLRRIKEQEIHLQEKLKNNLELAKAAEIYSPKNKLSDEPLFQKGTIILSENLKMITNQKTKEKISELTEKINKLLTNDKFQLGHIDTNEIIIQESKTSLKLLFSILSGFIVGILFVLFKTALRH